MNRHSNSDRNPLAEGGNHALSLGQRIRQYVLSRIDSGEWPEGSRIPSEAKLVDLLGASRMTIHIALRDLSAEGVLLRKQGAGTFVAPRRHQSTFLELRNIHAEIIGRGNLHTTNVLSLESQISDLASATELNVPPGTTVFHAVLVHRENDRPIQIEDRIVNPQFAPEFMKQDYTTTTPNEHLMENGPLEEVEHVIQAVLADASNASLLELEVGDPVLLLRRRTWSRGMIATSARLYHPGMRFSLAGRMKVHR